MALATNQQVQAYSDQRVRVRAEAFRALVEACADDKLAIDDVYAACSQPSPTWTDGRTDGVPHLAAPSDILAYNELITSFAAWVAAEGNYAVVQKLCVNPAGS
jgi:cephalosporin hydroxylase